MPVEQRTQDTPQMMGKDPNEFVNANDMKKKIDQEETIMQEQKESKQQQKAEAKELKRIERKKKEAQEKRFSKDERNRAKREKRRLEIEQQDIKGMEQTARELDIETVKPKELKLRKLKAEKEIKLIPSRKVAGVMFKEAGIGLREGLQKAEQKIKKRLTLLPEKTGKLAMKGISMGIGGIKSKIEEEQANRRTLIVARQRAKLYAQKKMIYKEEMMKVGFGRKAPRQIQGNQRIGIGMPIFQPRQNVGLEKRTITNPIFQPRQSVGFEKKIANTLPLFQPKQNMAMNLNKPKNNNMLSIGKAKPLFEKRNISLFDFKKRNKK